MKLPRDLTGDELISALVRFGYIATRQTGSHVRLTSRRSDEHHVTVPRHSPLRVGTLNGILSDVAAHAGMTRAELIDVLFD